MDFITGAFSSRLLLIFLVIFPPVLISVWLIYHPCRDIVTNGASGSFAIMANTPTQLEIYYLPLILSSQARLVQAFDSLTVHLDSVIVFKSFPSPLAESTPNNGGGNCFPWNLEQVPLLWIPLSNWGSKQIWNKFQAQMECARIHTHKLIACLLPSLLPSFPLCLFCFFYFRFAQL